MASILLTDRFVEELSLVYSDRIRAHIRQMVIALEQFPEMGSPDIPASIRRDFGDAVRKIVVPPFDLFYEYDEATDVVTVETLVHFRRAS